MSPTGRRLHIFPGSKVPCWGGQVPKILVRAPPGHSWYTGPLWASDGQVPEGFPLGLPSGPPSSAQPAGRAECRLDWPPPGAEAQCLDQWSTWKDSIPAPHYVTVQPAPGAGAFFFFFRFSAFTNTSYRLPSSCKCYIVRYYKPISQMRTLSLQETKACTWHNWGWSPGPTFTLESTHLAPAGYLTKVTVTLRAPAREK